MNLFDTIFKVFIPLQQKDVIALDKFTTCIVAYNISNFKQFTESAINDILLFVSDVDNFDLSFKIGENDELNLKTKNASIFFQGIIKERELVEEESVLFKLEIKKNNRQLINIYDFKSFNNFWKSTSLISLLNLIKNNQSSFGQLNFVLIEKEVPSFFSQNIIFSSKSENSESTLNNTISENCHFGNIKEYPFNPYYFNLILRPKEENSISEKLDKLSLMFCIISIFDITAIKGSKLYYKLNGYKSYEGNITVEMLDNYHNEIYFKIFDWIYSENSKISDKIGLARNIISLSLKEEDISLTDSVYLSIQSAYKTYLRDNISKYIEIRNKIVDELGWISQKAGEIVGNYLNSYQKSIFTFLSFFISVFLLQFLGKNEVEHVFSKDVTIFSLSFLILSIVYLVFSIWNIYLEKKRLIRKYDNLKNRYTDLLNSDDINRILKNDEEFDYELSFIDKRMWIYTALWIITIIILSSAVLSASIYLNLNSINMIIELMLCKNICS